MEEAKLKSSVKCNWCCKPLTPYQNAYGWLFVTSASIAMFVLAIYVVLGFAGDAVRAPVLAVLGMAGVTAGCVLGGVPKLGTGEHALLLPGNDDDDDPEIATLKPARTRRELVKDEPLASSLDTLSKQPSPAPLSPPLPPPTAAAQKPLIPSLARLGPAM